VPAQTPASRFEPLDPDELTAEQRRVAAAITNGPRGDLRGPFPALLRSPELADRVQHLGEYIRFGNALATTLKELAVLLTARKWAAEFEWWAHRQLALEAGLSPAIVDAIAAGRRPEELDREQAAVYEFASELLASGGVLDETFQAVRGVLGDQGVVDLTCTVGYYSLVAFVLNVDRVPVPHDDTGSLPAV
jgi:4-carboxymuconolactone decarboxylase